MNSAIIVLLLL